MSQSIVRDGLAGRSSGLAGRRTGLFRAWMAIACWISMACVGVTHAQVPPTAAPDQAALLKSADPQLAANKKLVFDMWRAIIQGAHTELAPKYFTEDYIQHNPNVATGRDAMVAYMKATRPVRPIKTACRHIARQPGSEGLKAGAVRAAIYDAARQGDAGLSYNQC